MTEPTTRTDRAQGSDPDTAPIAWATTQTMPYAAMPRCVLPCRRLPCRRLPRRPHLA
jgi:hypothetical protein